MVLTAERTARIDPNGNEPTEGISVEEVSARPVEGAGRYPAPGALALQTLGA